MQTFLDYLTRRPDESGLSRGFGLHAFIEAGPAAFILEATLLVLCGFLIAGCFRYRGAGLHRLYLMFAFGPLAWGIGIFTWRMLEVIDILERSGGVWGNGLGEVSSLSETLSEITAVLLTCTILTGIFLALSPVLRPRPTRERGVPPDSRVAV